MVRKTFVGLICSTLLLGIGACDSRNLGAAAKAQEARQRPAGTMAAYTGRVVSITDGDTIKVLVDGRDQRIIRFAEIDAPEKSQPWGNRSKQTLSGLVFQRDVEVRPTDTDRYGRTVAHVLVDGRDVNREMVAVGAAWAFRRYLVDQSLVEVEATAKRRRVGLWSMADNEIIAPWDWRSGLRVAPASDGGFAQQPRPLMTPAPAPSTGAAFSCGSKTRCREMSSCAEAQSYLRQCGLDTIDGNHDGEPCEVLCGTASR